MVKNLKQFIDRQEEITELRKILIGEEAALINLYGRRRIGKTEILKELKRKLKDSHKVLYFVFSLEDSKTQLQKFSTALGKAVPEDQTLQIVRPNTWEEVITVILRVPEDIIVFLDEFPNLISVDESIASIIQNTWDTNKNGTKVKILLCGSSVSIMSELMEQKQPLYGRFTHSKKIEPFDFVNTRLFLEEVSFENQFIIYSILGGIGQYLEAIQKVRTKPIEKILTETIFSRFTFFREDQRKGHFFGPCATCGFAYTGMGFEGMVHFRDDSLMRESIYYHQDYYNEFFSLTKKWKDKSYYRQGYARKRIDQYLEATAS